jgi:hypothetical protein
MSRDNTVEQPFLASLQTARPTDRGVPGLSAAGVSFLHDTSFPPTANYLISFRGSVVIYTSLAAAL